MELYYLCVDISRASLSYLASPEFKAQMSFSVYRLSFQEELGQENWNLHESFPTWDESHVFRSWSPGIGWDHNRGNNVKFRYREKYLRIIFFSKTMINQVHMQASLGSQIKLNSNHGPWSRMGPEKGMGILHENL